MVVLVQARDYICDTNLLRFVMLFLMHAGAELCKARDYIRRPAYSLCLKEMEERMQLKRKANTQTLCEFRLVLIIHQTSLP
jgi:hypothetical protein